MSDKTFIVYKHTAPNGKVYIGITSQEKPTRRWQHGAGYRTQTRFARAIAKYGWDNILHEVLFVGLTQEEAEQKEIDLIAAYKSTDPRFGYNQENGGNVLGSHSQETRNKISEAQRGEKNHRFGKPARNKGKKATPEEIEKNRLSHLGKTPWNKGKTLTEKQKANMSKPKTEEWKAKLSAAKAIPVMCMETGEVFESGKAAGDAYGISRGSIAYVCNGARNTAGGFHWMRLNKEEA